MTLRKIFAFIATAIIITFVFFVIKITVFKMPTKEIKVDDIKSINIINFNQDRKIRYEKDLKSRFGNYFLGHKIGKNMRLSNTCNGKKELIAKNIINGEQITYDDVKNKKDSSTFKNGVWKICSKYVNECLYFSKTDGVLYNKNFYNYYHDNFYFNVFGCWFSHVRAIKKISKQPDDTYGIIFEDDFGVSDDFNENFKKSLANVPKDFDILKLTISDHDIRRKRKKLQLRSTFRERIRSYIKNGYSKWIDLSMQNEPNCRLFCGSHAYLVSSQGAKKILSFLKGNYTTSVSDFDIFFYIPKLNDNIKVYSFVGEVPFLLNSHSRISSIITK